MFAQKISSHNHFGKIKRSKECETFIRAECLYFFVVSPFLMGLSNAYSFSHPFTVHILAKVEEMQVETKHGSYD